MLLRLDKERALKIKLLKSLYAFTVLIVLNFLSNSVFASNTSFEEDKIKVKVQYSENPNQTDFYTDNEYEKYTKIGLIENLDGIWSGSYILSPESVFWINSSLDNNKIHDLIYSGPYTISVKFNLFEKAILTGIEITQEDVKYSSINVNFANDKQINYWTKAKSRDWFQVIRGKIFRVSEDRLFTVFQTTVYEGKIPIYAFRGEVLLKKM